MNVSVIFKRFFAYFEFILIYNHTVECYDYNEGFAGSWYWYHQDRPTPPVHIQIDNFLNVPLRYSGSILQGDANFIGMKQENVRASSSGEIRVYASHPYCDISGSIQFKALDEGRDIPISIYFSIPNLYSKPFVAPWYGIQMHSTQEPNIFLEVAAEDFASVSQSKSFCRKFGSVSSNAWSRIVSRRGLVLTAFMDRTWRNDFVIKLQVWKARSHASTFRTTKRSPFSRNTTGRMTPTQIKTTLTTVMGRTVPTRTIPTSTRMAATTKTTTTPTTTTATTTTTSTTATTPTITITATTTTTTPTTTTTTTPTTTITTATTPTITTTTPTTATITKAPTATTTTTPTTTIPTATTSTTPTTTTITTTPTTTTTTTPTTTTATTTPTTTTATTTSTTTTTTTSSTTTTTTPTTTTSTIPTTTTTTTTTTTPKTTTSTTTPSTTTLVFVTDDYEYYGETVPW